MAIQMSAAFLVTIGGGVVYLIAPGKSSELGRIAFFVGLFWLVFAVGRASVHL